MVKTEPSASVKVTLAVFDVDGGTLFGRAGALGEAYGARPS